MRTAVVILNWNGRTMLERFMPSVVQHTQADVIVADNGSIDDSVTFLQQHYPQVRLILLDKNYGFADGYNRALAQLEGYDYYVLRDLTPGPSTLMACPRGAAQRRFVGVADETLIRYNSRLPLVVYTPRDVELRYRVWQAGPEQQAP